MEQTAGFRQLLPMAVVVAEVQTSASPTVEMVALAVALGIPAPPVLALLAKDSVVARQVNPPQCMAVAVAVVLAGLAVMVQAPIRATEVLA